MVTFGWPFCFLVIELYSCVFKTLIFNLRKGTLLNDCFSRNNWCWEDQPDATLS